MAQDDRRPFYSMIYCALVGPAPTVSLTSPRCFQRNYTRVIPHNQLLAFDTRRSDTTSLYRAISEDFHRLDGLEVDGSVVSGPRRLSSSLHPRAYAHISGTAEAIVQFCSRTRSSCILSLISHVLGTSLIPTNYLPRKKNQPNLIPVSCSYNCT